MPAGQMGDELSPRLYEALRLTVQLHGRDARKSSPVPVLAHLLAVCAIVQRDGGDEDEAIAALLHDSLEDKPSEITEAELRDKFGNRVVEMIRAASDTPADWDGRTPKPSWESRKRGYLAHVGVADPTLLRPTIADKIDNLRALLADYRTVGEHLWTRFNAPRDKQLWYYRACCTAYANAGISKALIEELDQLVTTLEMAVAEADGRGLAGEGST